MPNGPADLTLKEKGMATALDNVVLPQVELVETDGVPMESPWHWAAIVLLVDVVR